MEMVTIWISASYFSCCLLQICFFVSHSMLNTKFKISSFRILKCIYIIQIHFYYTDFIYIYIYIYQLKKEGKWIYMFARCL